MGKTGISVKIPNTEYALRIVREFSENERYLRDLTYRCVPNLNGADVDSMDYGKLLRHGRAILGVAKKYRPRLENPVSEEQVREPNRRYQSETKLDNLNTQLELDIFASSGDGF